MLVAISAPASTSAAAEPDVHFFKLKIVSSGSVTVDYGDDRHQSGTTAAGVDGKASVSRRWEIRAVAKSVGSGPLLSTAAITRARDDFRANLVDYSILMGQISESPICTDSVHAVTDDERGFALGAGVPEFVLGEFVKEPTRIRIGGGGSLTVEQIPLGGQCSLHHFDDHGLLFLYGASGDDARIPRGAFNPRFDHSYSKTFRSAVNEGQDHDLSDPNQLHTFAGSTKLKIKIKAVDEDRYLKRGRRYHNTPSGTNSYFQL